MIKNIRNIGILAHVDAGKTTLTEQILYHCGAVRQLGRVDHGTAHTDTLAIERQRGISIRAQSTAVDYRDVTIHMIDTPGHVDFSYEVESALAALDGAVLVVSAVEGVQAQTAVIAHVLKRLQIPCLVFINKIDRAGADVARTLKNLQEILPQAVLASEREALLDNLSLHDDVLLDAALEGRCDDAMLQRTLQEQCGRCLAMPVLCGSALKGEGIAAVLDGIVDWLPAPKSYEQLSAVVYNVAHRQGERQAFVRVFGGTIDTRALEAIGKISRIRKLTPQGYKPVSLLKAGEIGMLVGVRELRSGSWLGERLRGEARMNPPLLSATVCPERDEDIPRLTEALKQLHDEDPTLDLRYETRLKQFRMKVMGTVQREVLEQTLREQFSVPVRLGPSSVLFQETPLGIGHGSLDRMTSPWYAALSLKVEPAAKGSGVRIDFTISTDYLYERYQREIRRGLLQALQEGLHGWPLTDIQITVYDGACISVSLPPSTFAPLMPIPLFEALENAGVGLLEPVNRFEIRVPSEIAGIVISDLMRMQAVVNDPINSGDQVLLNGLVPVRTSMEYPERLLGLSRGTGTIITRFADYRPCPEQYGSDAPRTMPDPRRQEEFELSLNWFK